MRVGIIGAGNIARFAHIPGYQKLPDVEIVAICDIIEPKVKQVAAEYGIAKTFTDYRQMLKLPLDAVSICVPNSVHAEAAMVALQAGANVLCEKPMAMNAAQAGQMVRTAAEAGKILMMGFNNRFRSDTQAVKRMIEAGSLGDIYFARAGWLRRKGIPGRGSWFTRKSMSGGGALIDIGVHALDLAVWLMGKPEPVSVMGATYAKFGPDPSRGTGGWGEQDASGVFDVDDLACAMIRFANGSTLLLEASWASHVEKEQMFLSILGTQAGVQIVGSPPQTTVFSEQAGLLQDTRIIVPDAVAGGGHAAEIAEFVRCVKEGREPMSSGEDGVRVMRVLDAIYASAATGASVAVD